METQQLNLSEFRAVLGHYPTGVVVVTGFDDGQPTGMSCNSFTSVSLDPPLVGFFPAVTSSTWPSIRNSGRFCVNILASHHSELSRTFSRRDIDRFAGVPWSSGPTGPRLDEAVAWLDCELFDETPAGDHTLALGLVSKMSAAAEVEPLVFHRGGYARLDANLSQ
jgi:flavin reductase (DIM6/NTAB) family NADH-FMN oxidoreductase RutF